METNRISEPQMDKLLSDITPILLEKGPKATTMDLVAHRLSISKRTLYEIFGSKDGMMTNVIARMKSVHQKHVESIFQKKGLNMMEALIQALEYHQKVLEKASVNFFIDMEEKYPLLRSNYYAREQWNNAVLNLIERGVEQGVFLPDIDHRLHIQMLRVQMESIKRMENSLPSGLTILEAINAITLGFLRSIATEKGHEVLRAHNFQSKGLTSPRTSGGANTIEK